MLMRLQAIRRFGKANKGLAAVEFALLAPMMIFLLFGSVDLIDALASAKRVELASVSLADVVSRDTEVSDDEIDGLWAALDLLMFPDPSLTMDVRVTSVRIVTATRAEVVWSEGRNAYGPLSTGAVITLPAGMMRAGTSLIMTEARYEFEPPVGFLFIGGTHFEHTAYRRSRLVDPIPRV
jgi:Flp pilus assembly protein TadG